MRKKVTFEEALERFADRNDIILCEDGWNGWKDKSKFFDKVANDYFFIQPEKCFYRKSVHPSRRLEKLKQTNLNKYGVECVFAAKKIKEKIKQTNIEKYGVENPAKNKDILAKMQQTNIEKYGNVCSLHGEDVAKKVTENNKNKWGVDYYSQTEEYKERYKKTCLERYGAENPNQNEEIREKAKKTNLVNFGVEYSFNSSEVREKIKKTFVEKYGFENPSQNEEVRNRVKNTNIKKYGSPNYFLTKDFKEKSLKTNNEKYNFGNYQKHTSNRVIKETNELLTDWWAAYPSPKPSYTTVKKYFPNNEISLDSLLKFMKDYKEGKTTLEMLAENILGVTHFNCQPSKDLKYRPDFKLSEEIFVNVDGFHWHSENIKGKNYHFQMRKDFEQKNLRLFQFYQNELLDKPDIVKSIVNNALGLTRQKIFARKCRVKPVTHKEAQIFLKENHLMGSTYAKHIGLYFNDELVSLMSFKEKKNVLKIERFCSKLNVLVVGSFSRLVQNILKSTDNNISEVHNWVDLRYGTGTHLSSKGFIVERETLGWKWSDGYQTYNRLSCRANMDERGLSEAEHAEELCLEKIYDAGQRLWIKKV